ncbi:MAG TPA: hypothetical protein PLN06_10760 [Bacteroidales bacterium]|nr:hypothetical protein [Smithella sp.]HOU97082.1 hypothetical protein [Bacteroidales bacterium]
MSSINRIKFLHDIIDVKFNGSLADLQNDGDIPCAFSTRQPLQDFFFPAT